MRRLVSSPLEGARVLILEDEYFLADDLARALRDAGGEPVGPVGTIEEAEELVNREPLDAAILDLNLRGKMAYQFIEQLSATDLPCLIVSGYGDDALPECVRSVSRVEKPITASAVLRSLATELARAN